VHDRHVIDVTLGSFEKETEGINPDSGAHENTDWSAVKNAADLEADSTYQRSDRAFGTLGTIGWTPISR
jgi:hypothetical protein